MYSARRDKTSKLKCNGQPLSGTGLGHKEPMTRHTRLHSDSSKIPQITETFILDLHNNYKPCLQSKGQVSSMQKAREMAAQWSQLRCRNCEGNSREPRLSSSVAYLVIINMAFQVGRDEDFIRRELKKCFEENID